ncbi:MAG TPA: hypothetical protein VIL47_02685 [Candidatus Bipolaricaulota bacterium]
MKIFLRVALSLAFLALGVVGWVLPILPGWLFVLVGLLGLSTVYPPLRHPFELIKRRYPRLHAHLAHWQEKLFPEKDAK